MRYALMPLFVLAMSGCNKNNGDEPTTSFIPTTQCPDTGCGTGQSDDPGYMVPVAVGIEVHGVLYDDGTLHPLVLSDGTELAPYVLFTFADEEYFGLGAYDDRTGHYCEVLATIDPTPQGFADPAFQNLDVTGMNWSYEVEDLFFDAEFIGSECGGVLDPATYGTYGEILVGNFNGAHLGFGFAGSMSSRLWDAYGGIDATENEDIVDELFGMYVAINDKDGHWGGCDWTSARLFAVDDNDAEVEDPDNPGYLLPLKIDGVGSGPLPKGYLRTYAYWYQDFWLMSKTATAPWDFSHMMDAPVNGDPECGDW